MKRNDAAVESGSSHSPRVLRGRPRVPVSLAVVIEHDDASFQAVAVDLGLGGIFVEPTDGVSYGLRVDVLVELPGLEHVRRLPGVVRWTRGSGFGIQFLQLGVHETQAIGALMAAIRRRGSTG
jgi:hypothetical protein